MYQLISFVKRGKVRARVLQNISKPRTPTELSEMIQAHRSTTSRAILSLENKGLVKCLTPKQKMGRLYLITDKGKRVLKEGGF
jgi:DNA-binding MarR family transcriptional regulator